MKTQFWTARKAPMVRKFIVVLLACWFVATGAARAQSLDQEMTKLADQVSKSLVSQSFKSVAAIDFTDLQGQPTELGRFLAEELAVDIVSSGGVSMVDRANIKSILAEHKLTEEGLVNPENAKKLGEFAGVDVILTGNVTALDDGIVLMVKAVATSSSRIVAAGRIKFPKTSEIQQLLNRGVSGDSLAARSPDVGGGGNVGASYQDASAIATKDIGSLRLVLKSVLPVGSKDQRTGLQVSFEFTNLETRNPLVVAMNGEVQNRYSQTAARLRSSLLDDRGGVWNLLPSGLQGLGFVRVGVHGLNGAEAYAPTEIGRLLQLLDDLGKSYDDPTDGYTTTNNICGMQGSYTYDNNPPPKHFCPYTGNTFVSGSKTTFEHGQSGMVTMTFVPQAGNVNYTPRFLQFQGEIVVGVATAGTKMSYSLQNLTFDQVNMPITR